MGADALAAKMVLVGAGAQLDATRPPEHSTAASVIVRATLPVFVNTNVHDPDWFGATVTLLGDGGASVAVTIWACTFTGTTGAVSSPPAGALAKERATPPLPAVAAP